MNVMTVRLMSEECWETHLRVAFETADSGESCALEIRRGVCQFYDAPPQDCDATTRFDRGLPARLGVRTRDLRGGGRCRARLGRGRRRRRRGIPRQVRDLQPEGRDRHRGALTSVPERPAKAEPWPVARPSIGAYKERLTGGRLGADRQSERRPVGAGVHLSHRPSWSPQRLPPVVMPGLVPGIHVSRRGGMSGYEARRRSDVDARNKSGHDGRNAAGRPPVNSSL